MTRTEIRMEQARDQVLAILGGNQEAIERIASGGREDTESDESLCRMMASAILGEVMRSRHYAKVEPDDG